MISLLIPVFNEEEAIADTLTRAHDALKAIGEPFEIVVVDDGSTDRTAALLAQAHIKEMVVIRHPKNRGYGASMKTGIRKSHGDVMATIDADGTYPIEELPNLYKHLKDHEADMVVGARTKKGVQIPNIRRPAKKIVNWLANILVGQRIPDTNSGMRIFTRDLAERFFHLYPQGFSFTMTITLAALTNNYDVEFVPIDYFKRQGKSSLSQGFNGVRNFLNFLGLVIRIVTYFRPLRFFVWPSFALMGLGIVTIIETLINERNVSDAGTLLLVVGLQIGLFGLLADVVIRHRDAH